MKQIVSIGILCNDSPKQFSWKKKPFVKQELNQCYEFFSECAEKNNFLTVISTIKNYSNGNLAKGWVFEKGKGKWKKIKSHKIEIALDKFKFSKKNNKLRKKIAKEIFLVNNPRLEIFCKDKWLLKKSFPKMVPKTFLAENAADLEKAKSQIFSTKIVIKPRYGLAGQKIRILKKCRTIKLGGEKIVQEFLESKNGIPELGINGRHDLRLIVLNGKIENCFVRKPAKHRLIANVSKGGKASILRKKLPKKIVEIAKKIDSKMEKFGFRLYTADFIKSRNRFYLIELNSKPSFLVFIDTKSKKEGKIFCRKFFGQARKELEKIKPSQS